MVIVSSYPFQGFGLYQLRKYGDSVTLALNRKSPQDLRIDPRALRVLKHGDS
jgi:hypothetical protein